MASLLSWVGNKAKTVEQHVANTVHNDVVAPINRNVVQPIAHAPAAIDNAAVRSPIGRGLQTVGLGALRSGTGTLQGVSGLYDLATPGVGTNRFSKGLNSLAQNTDITAKANHSNPLLYHGAQTGTDLLTLAGAGEAVKAASKIPVIGQGISAATKLPKLADTAIGNKVAPKLATLADKGFAGRVAARTADNALKPGYQASNAAFTALQTGKNASQGKRTTPLGVGTNLATGAVALPLAGAITHEATAPVINAAAKSLRDANIIRPSKLTDSEVAQLAKFNTQSRSGAIMDDNTYNQGVAAAKKAGVNYQDPKAVSDLVGAHMNYNTQVQKRVDSINGMKQQLSLGNEFGGVGKNVKSVSEIPATPTPKLPRLATPATAPVEPASEVPLAQTTPKLGKFAQGVATSPEVSPETQSLIKQEKVTYDPTTNKSRVAAANHTLEGKTDDEAYLHAIQGLSNSSTANDQDVVNAIQAAKRLDSSGGEANQLKATEIYHNLSDHLTKKGQEIQAASILARRSPEGIGFAAQRQLEKGGIKLDGLSPEDQAKFGELKKNVRGTTEGSQERYDAIGALHDFVTSKVPSSKLDKAFGLWRTGLLTGPQTVTKVAASHTLQNILENVKQIPATAIDKAISPFTGQRSTALTGRGTISGAKIGLKAGSRLLRTGKDTMGTGGFSDSAAGMLAHPDLNYGNSITGKAANFYTRKVGQVHAAIPKAFFTSAQANDLFKQGIAAAKTQGLHGGEADSFVKNFVENASEDAKNEATHAGQMATFQQHTKLGEVSKKFQQAPGGRLLAPFAHIASAILTDAEDYSPVGAGKAVYQAIKDKGESGWTPTVQKHFVEELGRSITGTAAIATGYELYKHGVMTLNYPTSQKEQALWKAEGKQENAIKIGNRWRSTASLGPIGTVLAAGGYVSQGGQGKIKKGQAASAVGDALEGGLENVTGQSFLSGSTDFAKAIANPTEYGTSELKNVASSVVPIAVGTIARATDPLQRQTNGAVQSVESKIPGLREKLPAQVGAFGNTLPRQGGVATNLLDPTRPTDVINNPVNTELERLDKTTGTPPIPLAPTLVTGKDANGKSQTINFTKEQGNQLLQAAGPQIQQQTASTINSPAYKALSDDDKSKVLANISSDNLALAKNQLAAKQGITTKLNTAQQALQAGNPTDYAAAINAPSTASYYKTPDAEYNAQLASYNTKLKANSFGDPAAKLTAQKNLAKAKVGSTFDKAIRDDYNLSDADLYNYVSNDPNGNAIVQQVLAYSQALKDAGITSTAKFMNKYGDVTLGKSTVASSSSSSGGAKKTTVKIPKAINTTPKAFKIKIAKAPKAKSTKLKIPKIATIKKPKVTKVLA